MLHFKIATPVQLQVQVQLQLDLNMETPKFKPKFLHELVNYLYEDKPEIIRQHELEQILIDAHG